MALCSSPRFHLPSLDTELSSNTSPLSFCPSPSSLCKHSFGNSRDDLKENPHSLLCKHTSLKTDLVLVSICLKVSLPPGLLRGCFTTELAYTDNELHINDTLHFSFPWRANIAHSLKVVGGGGESLTCSFVPIHPSAYVFLPSGLIRLMLTQHQSLERKSEICAALHPKCNTPADSPHQTTYSCKEARATRPRQTAKKDIMMCLNQHFSLSY